MWLVNAIDKLFHLDLIGEQGKLTVLDETVREFPLDLEQFLTPVDKI